METGITGKLAAHVSRLRYEDIPPDVIEKAKDCILDQVGVELIGSILEWNKIAYRYVMDMGGRPESTIVNYGTKAFQQYPPGSPLNPVSRDELRKKFRKLAGAVLPASQIDQIIESVDRLESSDDAADLTRLLVQ